MKRAGRRCLVTLSLAAMMALSATPGLAVSGTVNVSKLVLRQTASTESAALQTLPAGEKVEILSTNGDWYQVQYGRFTGYVMKRYITVEKDTSTGTVSGGQTAIRALRPGDKGENVKVLQRRLKELGYYSASIDGNYGDVTKKAVEAFQKDKKLIANGICDATTLKKLDLEIALDGSVTSTSDTLRSGDRGDAVKKLQTRLKELGYYKNTLDGSYGSGTVSAVKKFQERNGIAVTGVADAVTQAAIYSSSAKGATDATATPKPATEGLKSGDQGEEVKSLQIRLEELGYYKNGIDGVYGSGVTAAVKKFQQRNGLTVTGKADKTTLSRIYSSSAKPATDTTVTPKPGDGTLQKGSTGEAVKELQKRLKELGYYNNTADGSYGDKTAAAVKAFQQRNGLTADGVADSATQKKLYSDSAKGATDTTPTPKPATEGLQSGDQGEEVKSLQIRLEELGYYKNGIDGVYGSGVTAAVKKFQQRNGLTVTGKADKTTLSRIYSSSAKPATDPTATPKPDDGTLQKGSTGEAVKKLQARLKELGYYKNTTDGSYGDKTVEAVKAFQKRNGLTADGVADSATQKKLYSDSAKGATDTTPTPKPATEGLQSGDQGEEVKSLQIRLEELGYYKNGIDGVYGSGVTAAVKKFQQRNGLTVTGKADKTTLSRIYSSSAKPSTDPTATPKPATEGLQSGDQGEEVKSLQIRLEELGYYKNGIDGVYGSGVTAAVKKFQQRNGLTVTGKADKTTLSRIYSSSAKPATDATTTSKPNDDDKPNTNITLKLGSEGAEVKRMQTRLKELGYFTPTPDGSFGQRTETAVKDFQKRNGLTVDGEAGPVTLTKLYSANAKAADSGNDSTTLKPGSSGSEVRRLQARLKELGYYKFGVDGSYGSVTRTAVEDFQRKNGLTVTGNADQKTLDKVYSANAIAAGTSVAPSTDLRLGDSGAAVRELQSRLKELGYYHNGIDGDFGAQTEEAVKAFQKRNGLTADGVVGSSTRSKLNSSSAKPAEDSTDKPSTATSLKPGDSGTAVKEMQTRLKSLGYYSSAIDGSYGAQTTAAVQAFQRNNSLTVDGIAGSATLNKLYSSSARPASSSGNASQYVTEQLDWFKNGDSVFHRGAVISVKDVRTGKVFLAKVQSAGNHLDAEPLTIADTATLRAIYGGSINWRRRPMLVLYNGHVYASSIYGEAHGASTIEDNGFDGQFCLHFYMSRTNGSDVVDADHQACVQEAMKATW